MFEIVDKITDDLDDDGIKELSFCLKEQHILMPSADWQQYLSAGQGKPSLELFDQGIERDKNELFCENQKLICLQTAGNVNTIEIPD
ncbi:hypothetical protein BpHYR1_008522 [Brachionus plicatilis]|uniref:Uncharacterized protein n=1 Tax=Brachionus plicatilis TaxID=10195 RepID=A0A3M7T528_BRAPC|nr:hypothetical protein BpHYR1_008522 [Brachionus plicatilis]